MKNTIADRILDRLLSGDGCATRTRLGVDRYALVRRIGEPVRDRLGNTIGWGFADGSEINESGGGWDTPEGWAAQGTPPDVECWCCGEPATTTERDSGDRGKRTGWVTTVGYTVEDAIHAAVERAARDSEGTFVVCVAPDGSIWMLDHRAAKPEGSRTHAVVQRWNATKVQIKTQEGESRWVNI